MLRVMARGFAAKIFSAHAEGESVIYREH